jgi:hypothetical protein
MLNQWKSLIELYSFQVNSMLFFLAKWGFHYKGVKNKSLTQASLREGERLSKLQQKGSLRKKVTLAKAWAAWFAFLLIHWKSQKENLLIKAKDWPIKALIFQLLLTSELTSLSIHTLASLSIEVDIDIFISFAKRSCFTIKYWIRIVYLRLL